MQSGNAATGARIRTLRRMARLSQEELAERADSSGATISRIERGLVGKVDSVLLSNIASALGVHLSALFEGSPIDPSVQKPEPNGSYTPNQEGARKIPAVSDATPNVVGRVDELRARTVKPVAIYRWGTCGDPRQEVGAPDPDRLDYPPLGRELLVGPRGFGVEVRGRSMTRRGIEPGDVVWVNPDMAPQIDRPVLARCWDADDVERGMVVKVWRNGDGLTSDGETDEDLDCQRYEIIGRVVLVSRTFPPL